MSYLLDADVVISFLNGRPEAIELVDKLADEGLAVSIIVCGEVYEGLLRDSSPDQRFARFETFTATVDVITPDTQVARQYARIRSQLRAQGQILADNDLWIAATAVAHDLTLVRGDKHFQRIPDVRLHQPG